MASPATVYKISDLNIETPGFYQLLCSASVHNEPILYSAGEYMADSTAISGPHHPIGNLY